MVKDLWKPRLGSISTLLKPQEQNVHIGISMMEDTKSIKSIVVKQLDETEL